MADRLLGPLTNGQNRGTGSAKEGADSSGPLGGFNGMLEPGHQGGAMGLVEAIMESTAGLFIFPLDKSGGDAGGVPEIIDCVLQGNAGGQDGTGRAGGGFDAGDGGNKL